MRASAVNPRVVRRDVYLGAMPAVDVFLALGHVRLQAGVDGIRERLVLFT